MCAQHVYEWWVELNARREPGFDSLAPIQYSEITSWKRETGREIVCTPVEVRWLMTMDDKWIETVSEERKARQERDKEAAESKQPSGK